ncbi:hypothetical protein [Cytophaga hutchinsonii]
MYACSSCSNESFQTVWKCLNCRSINSTDSP